MSKKIKDQEVLLVKDQKDESRSRSRWEKRTEVAFFQSLL